jgi:hypothetical protein
LFLYFVKIGSVLYGSGYVLLAFLQQDLVRNWHWLTSKQLLDAVAVGQITPGPLFTTATFIGYFEGPAGSGGRQLVSSSRPSSSARSAAGPAVAAKIAAGRRFPGWRECGVFGAHGSGHVGIGAHGADRLPSLSPRLCPAPCCCFATA